MLSIFKGRAMTAKRSQETKPITFKKEPAAISAIKLNVKVDKEARE